MDDTSALLFEMHGTTVALMLNQPSRRNALSYKMRGVVNVPCGPINNLQQMFDDPQVQHRGIRVTSPHPRAALAHYGFATAEIDALIESGATFQT